MKQIMT